MALAFRLITRRTRLVGLLNRPQRKPSQALQHPDTCTTRLADQLQHCTKPGCRPLTQRDDGLVESGGAVVVALQACRQNASTKRSRSGRKPIASNVPERVHRYSRQHIRLSTAAWMHRQSRFLSSKDSLRSGRDGKPCQNCPDSTDAFSRDALAVQDRKYNRDRTDSLNMDYESRSKCFNTEEKSDQGILFGTP
jgi:hypothetical protein